MDGAREYLESLRRQGQAKGRFLGLLNVVIGRRIARADGTVISTGVTWRDLAIILKDLRWDRDAVRELGMDPAALPPRDRQRYWYAAISGAGVDSAQATQAGDQLQQEAAALGFVIGNAPGRPAAP